MTNFLNIVATGQEMVREKKLFKDRELSENFSFLVREY